jgi:hypothetical protein
LILHDLSDWPLAITIARGTSTAAEHSSCLTEWDRWFVRGEGFAFLRVLADSEAVAHTEHAAHETRAWLRAQGGRIRTQLISMATVAPARELTRVNRLDAESLIDAPVQAFSDVDAAIDWLEWFIAPPSGGSWDRGAIRARLGLG